MAKCSGFATQEELGFLPRLQRYGVQIVSVNRGTYPQSEGNPPRSNPGTECREKSLARGRIAGVSLAHPTLDLAASQPASGLSVD